MDTLTAKKSIFDMCPEEFEELTRPVALKAKQVAFDNGVWFSYKNQFCIEPDMFIREFKDGHRELIKLGNQTGEYTVLKAF